MELKDGAWLNGKEKEHGEVLFAAQARLSVNKAHTLTHESCPILRSLPSGPYRTLCSAYAGSPYLNMTKFIFISMKKIAMVHGFHPKTLNETWLNA